LIYNKQAASFAACLFVAGKRGLVVDFAVDVGVAVGSGIAVVFDFLSPLKPSAEEVEGDLRLPTD
jgi:hypothetical protein